MTDSEGHAPYQIKDRRWWVRDDDADRAEETASKPTLVSSLEAELADRDRRLRETLERHREVVEEMSRARDRIEREARREVEQKRRDILATLLPVVDDLDRAIAAAAPAPGAPPPPPQVNALLSGLELVRSGFLDRLRSLGVERDDPADHAFDPARHEAVSVVEVPVDRDGTVVATVSPGYHVDSQILRPARVVVGKAPIRGAATGGAAPGPGSPPRVG